MYALHPEGERPAHSPFPSVGYFFFGGVLCFGACTRSEAATSLAFGGVFLLLNCLLASCAGFFPVAMRDGLLKKGTGLKIVTQLMVCTNVHVSNTRYADFSGCATSP